MLKRGLIGRGGKPMSNALSVSGGVMKKLFSKDSQPAGMRVRVEGECESFEANLGVLEKRVVLLRFKGKVVERMISFWPLQNCSYEDAGIQCVVLAQERLAKRKQSFRARLQIAGKEECEGVEVQFIS